MIKNREVLECGVSVRKENIKVAYVLPSPSRTFLFLTTGPEVQVSIPGANRFSE
jgi:hypothetical protein